MYTVSRILLIVALTSLFWIDAANAQAIPKSIQQGGSDAAIKERKNAWTVGLAGGLIDGTYMRFADELGKVLDDGDNLRILPMVSYGAASNLDDLLYLKNVDIAVTQADVFEYFRTLRKTLNLENRIHYIIRLPVSEMHVLAGTDQPVRLAAMHSLGRLATYLLLAAVSVFMVFPFVWTIGNSLKLPGEIFINSF